ncbi:MAG TPA: hypothetical protein VGQ30_10305 [Gemmatimonadaceae bacterium]|nr:hypothetical protein [Gemmatimonadaceae bacterium]
MSKLAGLVRAMLVFAAFAVTHARALEAQTLAQIGARLISTDRALDAAHDTLNRLVDEMKRREMPLDSLHVGAVTVRLTASDFSSSTIGATERAMAEAWADAQRALGDGAGRAASHQPIVLRRHQVANRLQLNELSFELTDRPGAGRTVTAPLKASAAHAAIIDLLGALAAIGEPSALDVYAGPWIPAARIDADQWSEVAIDLATAPSAVTRDCYAGSVKRCESALGLSAVKDPVTEWYSAEDWRVAVDRAPIPPNEAPERRERRERCIAGKAPEICEDFVREHPVARPLIIDSRRALIGLALELGGAKAYDRMMSAHGTALEILAAASGHDADDLVGVWRQRVLAATPPRVAPMPREVTTMLAWSALFAVVAFRKRK